MHVIFTDGEDETSKCSLADVLGMVALLNQKINVKTLKIIIFDVGSSSLGQQTLQAMAELGGDNVEYYSVHDVDLDSVFSHTTLNMGFQK